MAGFWLPTISQCAKTGVGELRLERVFWLPTISQCAKTPLRLLRAAVRFGCRPFPNVLKLDEGDMPDDSVLVADHFPMC